MLDANNDATTANQQPEPQRGPQNQPHDTYSDRAREAYDAGDRVLAMHLYLTAYEEASKNGPIAEIQGVPALRDAWRVACELKERSIAEYVFDKLEPHLSPEETQEYASELQGLALDKLSEFGISRSDLEDMADMISEEIGGNARISGIAPIVSMRTSGPSAHVALPEQSDSEEGSDAEASAEASETADAPSSEGDGAPSASAASAKPGVFSGKDRNRLRYADLVGFDGVIEDARALGLGVQQDEDYRMLIDTLRVQHGLESLSASGSVVFRTSSREDASMFMAAVVGELDLPAMRIQMQPSPQGMPILCVTLSTNRPARTTNRMMLEAPSVLVLEDFDLWGAPLLDAASATDADGIMFASMSRAARETMSLLSSAIENPEVYVLASMAGDAPDQSYLYDLMEPMNVVDIYLPDDFERRAIWNKAALDHPSLRQLDLARLTRLSRNLSRCDIATAAREAVEDAYRRSLKARRYVPVTQELMFEHVANFQPLDSDEYRYLEEAVVASFRAQMEADEASSALDRLDASAPRHGSDARDSRAKGGR